MLNFPPWNSVLTFGTCRKNHGRLQDFPVRVHSSHCLCCWKFRGGGHSGFSGGNRTKRGRCAGRHESGAMVSPSRRERKRQSAIQSRQFVLQRRGGCAELRGGGEMVSSRRRAGKRRGAIPSWRDLWQRLGGSRDDAEAKKWYSRAAKKGHVGAQGALAVLYGDSTPASPVRVEGGKTAESNSWGVFLLLIAVLYFAPTVVAFRREHNNAVPIFLVNLLFGWVYGIGWVIALLWAFSDNTKERRHKVVVNPDNPLNSLVVCQMCGRQISPRATACPGCGHPKEERDG